MIKREDRRPGVSLILLLTAFLVAGGESVAQAPRELPSDDPVTLESELSDVSNASTRQAQSGGNQAPGGGNPPAVGNQPPGGGSQPAAGNQPLDGGNQNDGDDGGNSGSQPTVADVIKRLDALQAALPPPRVDTAYDMWKPTWVAIGILVSLAAFFLLRYGATQNEAARRVQQLAFKQMEKALGAAPKATPRPSIHNVVPTHAPVTGGVVVAITGYGFDRSTTVTLDKQPCRVTSFAPDRIEFEVPPLDFQDGKSVDLVVNTEGRETMTQFRIESVALRADDVTLDSLSGGWTDVAGTGFSGDLSVKIGKTQLEHAIRSPQQLLVQFPARKSSGKETVRIVREDGRSDSFAATYP